MTHIRKRGLAVVLALAMVFSLCTFTSAAVGDIEVLLPNNDSSYQFVEKSGTVEMQLYVKNNKKDIGGNPVPVTIALVLPTDPNGIIAVIDKIDGDTTLDGNKSGWITVTATVNPNAASTTAELNFYLVGEDENTPADTVTVNIKLTSQPTTTSSPTPTSSQPKLRLSPTDSSGARVPAPSGDYGQKVMVRIPLVCQGDQASDIKISPVLTTSLDTFPFNIDALDYTLSYPGTIYMGSIIEFQYNFTLSKQVSAGVKQVGFNVTYRNFAGEIETTTVNVFVNVIKGSPTAAEPTPGAVSTPKLIVESYSISSEKIYAGETFDVTFKLRNTSSTEAIQNLQIKLSEANNVLKPANNGSNTLYVDKIAKGEVHTETVSLQTAPDANATTYVLNIEFGYEGASNKQPYTSNSTISIPILQKIRLKLDELVIYDQAYVEQPVAMYFAMYNLGKSTVYNCMVSIEGEGIRLEESFYGGNVAAGGTMRADFNAIPSQAGEITGNIVLTYEDVYGEVFEERLPFTLYVNDAFDPGMPDGVIEPNMPGKDIIDGGIEVMNPGGMRGGPSLLLIIGIAVVVIAAAAVIVIVIRKKRKRHLEGI